MVRECCEVERNMFPHSRDEMSIPQIPGYGEVLVVMDAASQTDILIPRMWYEIFLQFPRSERSRR